MLSRRALLFLPAQVTAVHLSRAAEGETQNLEYRGGRLYWPRGSAAAAVGRSGGRADKREGDGATPAGALSPRFVPVLCPRARTRPPLPQLPVRPLAPSAGWVDEPGDPNYTRPVSLPSPASAEQMWRQDGLYDALVVIGYNMAPVIPGAGSAIFLHVAVPDFAPTAGCVAVEKNVLLGLLPLLGPGSKITVTD